MQCFREKCTSVVLFRSGGLNLTKRWAGPTMQNVGDWFGSSICSIDFTLGLCPAPITVQVRRFRPREGDVCDRYWVDASGATRRLAIEPYALVDIYKTATYFHHYVTENAIQAMIYTITSRNSDPLIRDTYLMAERHFQTLRVSRTRGERGDGPEGRGNSADFDPRETLDHAKLRWPNTWPTSSVFGSLSVSRADLIPPRRRRQIWSLTVANRAYNRILVDLREGDARHATGNHGQVLPPVQ